MNVDNAVKIFKYNGAGPLHKAEFEDATLFGACFRPASVGVFPDRPATPPRKGEEGKLEGQAHTGAAGVKGGANGGLSGGAPKPKAVYRPPGSTGALAAMLRAEREAVAGPKKVTNAGAYGSGGGGGGGGGGPYIPGLAAPQENKNAAKNKAKKEKKKAAEAAAKAAEEERLAKEKADKEAKEKEAAANVDPEKKMKALQKKLKQIEDLKTRQAGGEALNADQKAKLTAEAEIREQMSKLKI
jgi:uncharacterized protein with WD repeat